MATADLAAQKPEDATEADTPAPHQKLTDSSQGSAASLGVEGPAAAQPNGTSAVNEDRKEMSKPEAEREPPALDVAKSESLLRPIQDMSEPETEREPPALDVAKSESLLRPIQAVPGYVAHTVGNLLGGATLGAGWAIGKADAKLGNAAQASDSEAFKLGFRAWLYANGIWPTVLCETGPYGNDLGPLPQDAVARRRMLRSVPLFVSNHVSYLDTVILPLVLEVPKLMAMAEVASWPLFGQLCQDMDMVWVDRKSEESRRAAREAIDIHSREWQDGDRPLLLWPEGTTSNGQGIKEFKSGAFSPGVPVRPVVIKYTGDWDPANVNFRVDISSQESGKDSPSSAASYGDKEWVEQFLGHLVHSCTVLICKPYYPTGPEKSDPELFKANVRKLMLERLEELTQREEQRKKNKDGLSKLGNSFTEASNDFLGGVEQMLGAAGRRLSETSEQVQQVSIPWLQKLWKEPGRPKEKTHKTKIREKKVVATASTSSS